jgi:hypothetical protein
MVGPPVLVEAWLATVGEDVLDVNEVVRGVDEVVDVKEDAVVDVEEVVDEDEKEEDMAEALVI